MPAGVPIHVSNPNLPKFGGAAAGEFSQARGFAQNGRTAELTTFVNGHMQANNNNLPNLFSAVNALHGVDNPAYHQMRTTTMQLAQKQIADGTNQPMPYVVVAQMSLQDKNSQKFNETTQMMMQKFPDSEYSHFYQGVQHLQNRDFKQAEESLNKARELGMPEETIAELMRVAIDNQKWIWEYALGITIVVALWLIGLLAIFVIGRLFSKRTLGNLHRNPDGVTTGDRWHRSMYRRLIAIAGLYYYLSLPIVLIISIALPLALGYAMLMVPYLNILLVLLILLIGLGGIITAISGIRTAFLRVKPFESGRVVGEDELPELWKLAREVAEKVGTRPVNQIRLLCSTDVCVFEKGSWLARRRDTSERVLVLGVGALYGMKKDALKSILAHEYGHFQNRDTAGGDIALRVNLAMNNFAQAIVKRGKIRSWDLAIHFLRLYHSIFRQLTFGASRLQEIYADRLAVQLYGANALREGLTHVIRRSVEYQWAMDKSLDNAIKTGVPAVQFFDNTLIPEIHERERIETVVNEVLSRDTDAKDSHPSPKDRFQLAEQLDPNPASLDDESTWDQVAANANLMTEMNEIIEHVVRIESSIILKHINSGIRFMNSVIRTRFNPNALFERARLYMSIGEYDKAVADLGDILTEIPEESRVRFFLASAFKKIKRYNLAIVHYELLVNESGQDEHGLFSRNAQITSEDHIVFLLALGECLTSIGNHTAAIEKYTEVLKWKSSSLAALVARGKAYAAIGEHELAEADFETAMKEWPGGPGPALRQEMDRLKESAWVAS
ncbi:MAG: M48 family metalloprotease [Planctomycetes bacterium]|nr:M48 family metalloprotease [Planctomycetota bacterium]